MEVRLGRSCEKPEEKEIIHYHETKPVCESSCLSARLEYVVPYGREGRGERQDEAARAKESIIPRERCLPMFFLGRFSRLFSLYCRSDKNRIKLSSLPVLRVSVSHEGARVMLLCLETANVKSGMIIVTDRIGCIKVLRSMKSVVYQVFFL